MAAPAGRTVRPTADRTRQALFNLLEHGRFARGGSRVAGAIVLDAFAGSGALALEAMSRGAARAVAIESDADAVGAIWANAERLGVGAALDIVSADACAPPPAHVAATLVFLDPPYGQALVPPALAALASAGWIADGALIAAETGGKEELAPPAGFTLADARRYGRAMISLLTYSGRPQGGASADGGAVSN